jgi:hypothetical protein
MKPLMFVVKAMRNIGQRESVYDNSSGRYESHYVGPEYVSLRLEGVGEDPEELKTELKLMVTATVARRFRLGAKVELWPGSGPRQKQAKAEVAELNKIFKTEAKP